MIAIIGKAISPFVLLLGLCIYLNLNQVSDDTSKSALFTQPTPPNKESANNMTTVNNPNGEVEYYRPLDTCQQIKASEDRSLCEAIIKDQGLTDRALLGKFVFTKGEFDLNGDGKKEIIVWSPTMDLGGTSGYPIIIFSRTAYGYRKLWEVDQAWTPVIVLKSKSNGWRDIAFQYGGGGADWIYNVIKYKDRGYIDSKTLKKQPEGEILIEKEWNKSVFGPIN